ncbi:CBS domain-containing protein [Nonomuraea rubra]|uniref:CBS domain-containing protein n=1 Tax=Nonomuraea rubra TaxID=46180 RepID=UPI0033E682B1
MRSAVENVMTTDAAIVTAARLMDRHGVKRLPVVDPDGRLAGIVSRRDLINVFLRRDQDIEQEVRGALHGRAGIADLPMWGGA